MKGIISLNNLPKKEIFLELKPSFCNYIKNKIKEKYSIEKFSELIGTRRTLYHWLSEKSLVRLDVFEKVIKQLGVNEKEAKMVVLSLRGKDGFKIKKPKIPFNFKTKAGVRFIAALFGDGCLDKKHRVFYANSNKDLINGFVRDAKKVFGNVEYNLRRKSDNKEVEIVSLPPICGKITSLLGFHPGSKVKLNLSVPQFIFKLRKKEIAEFISQIIDDEGSINLASRHIKINFALEELHKNSNLLDGIKELLLKLGVNSVIYQYENYPSSRGENRKRWQMEIHSFIYLQKLYDFLNLRHAKKRKKLKELLNSTQQIHFPTKECTDIYLSFMRKIEKEKGYFTSKDLHRKLDRNLGHIQNMLRKFFYRGLIYKIQDVVSDGTTFHPARYRVK